MSEIITSDSPAASEKPVPVGDDDKVEFPPFPEPTDDAFEDDIPEEERTYYKNKFPDLNAVKHEKLHCSACDRHLGCSARNEARMRVHPMLRTLVCHTCHTFYNSGEFDKGDDGSELYCRWCGQGGQVYCCSDCPIVFCAKCIKRNFGMPKIKEIENTDDWKCFKCNPRCLWDLRAVCWALLRFCDQRNKLNYALAGLRPWWWHACNVVLHAACCALVARACVTVARLQRPFAALAAVLFAVHPIHTEAVAGVVGRADVLACIFFLSSLLVYHRPATNKKCVWLSIILGAMSMLAKETGVTILLLNLAIDFYRCWPFVKRSICSLKIEKKCTGLTIRTVKVLVSLALLVSLRLALLQGTWPSFSAQDNPAAFHPSFLVRLRTFCYLAAFNWWLLLCPWTLSHDWQMGSVPLVTSGWDPRNLLTCAAFGALLVLCYRCIADLEVQRHTPAVIGLLLLVLPFLPASNLLVTVGFVIAERVLYIPSVGSVIITAYGVQLMWSRPGTKAFLVVGLAVVAASGVVRSHRRNADWRDRATLLRTDLVTLPQNAKLHYNFANFLRESEQQDNAIKHYKEALRLWPTYASAHNNLGTLVTGMENAEHHFLQAIKYNKYHVNAHFNLGKLYKKNGRPNQAVSMLERCIWLQPRFVQALVELLTLTAETEKQPLLKRLIEQEPRNWEHHVLYGDWYKMRGFPGPAVKFYLEATRLSFGTRSFDKPVRADLITFRSTALMYRSLGQRSRTLQLLTRWHTWRRGWPSAAATHLYLRDWRLKMELDGRVQIYSKAVNPAKSTRCFDHSQLAVESNVVEKKARQDTVFKKEQTVHKTIEKDLVITKSDKSEDCNCECKACGTKKRNLSIPSQIKNSHNKSEIGLKDKKCSLRRKDKNVKDTNVIPSLAGPLEHILIKTF